MEIKAFKGYRFDDAVVGNAGDCTAPPYDVIDDDFRRKLYDRNKYNIVRVIKGRINSSDTTGDDQYSRAADFLASSIESGAIKLDSDTTIYAYVQDFEIGSDHFQRSSFVALGKLTEFGSGVSPHEQTLDGPKADRLNLMRATAAQFGQIFMLYDDPEKIADAIIARAAEGSSLIDFADDDNVRHRLLAIDKSDDIDAIVAMMADKQCVIADGHHRYETALNYYNQTQNPAAYYRMMTFTNMRNEGLVILPTHRLVTNLPEFDIDKLLTEMHDGFDIFAHPFAGKNDKPVARQKMFDTMKTAFENGKSTLGIYAATPAFYTAVLKDSSAMSYPQMSDAAKKFDVNIIHKLILEEVLGIGEKELATQSNIEYIKDIGNAIDKSVAKVDSTQSQAVFFMNPTRIEQVRAVADAGEKMPQKSTFFYPKIHTGLVINKL